MTDRDDDSPTDHVAHLEPNALIRFYDQAGLGDDPVVDTESPEVTRCVGNPVLFENNYLGPRPVARVLPDGGFLADGSTVTGGTAVAQTVARTTETTAGNPWNPHAN